MNGVRAFVDTNILIYISLYYENPGNKGKIMERITTQKPMLRRHAKNMTYQKAKPTGSK